MTLGSPSKTAAPLALALLLAACDDTTFLTGGAEPVSGEGWCGVTSIFDGSCNAACHSAAASLGELDLETDPHAALVDVPSTYPGRTLVVPGDPDGSFLMIKLEGTQAAGEGTPMPQSGALSTEALELVRQWIADGATLDCGAGETGLP
jgi:hypothetical protein